MKICGCCKENLPISLFGVQRRKLTNGETKEVMKYATLDLAVAYCEDQVSKYEFKPEKVWGPKP